MSERTLPIVPEVFIINSQKSYWQLATLGQLAVVYATPTTVRCRLVDGVVDKRPTPVGKELTLQRSEVYCLPNAEAWEWAIRTRAAFQSALDALAAGLRELGTYAMRLEEAGGLKKAPNPLTPTVIHIDDPANKNPVGWWGTLPMRVPPIERKAVQRHTAKMIEVPSSYNPQITHLVNQADHFVCPGTIARSDDATWSHIEQLHKAVQQWHDGWAELLTKLGTYDAAAGDGRYASAPLLELTVPAAIVAVEPATPALPGALSASLQQIARDYLGAKRRMEEALLEAARYLSEARAACQHGEWGVFLTATRTSEGTAKRLLDIHAAAQRSEAFTDAVQRGLSATTAAELAQPSTPADLLERLLTQETLPTLEEVRQAKGATKSAKLADLPPATAETPEPAPARPTAAALAAAQERFAQHGYALQAYVHGPGYGLWRGSEFVRRLDDWAQVEARLAILAQETPAAPAPDPELATLATRAQSLGLHASIVTDEALGWGVLLWRDGEDVSQLLPLGAADARAWLDRDEAEQQEREPAVAAPAASSFRHDVPDAVYDADAFEAVATLVDDLNDAMSGGLRGTAMRIWLTLGAVLLEDAFADEAVAAALCAYDQPVQPRGVAETIDGFLMALQAPLLEQQEAAA